MHGAGMGQHKGSDDMVTNRVRKLLSILVAGGAVIAATPGNALTINLTDIGGVAGSPADYGFRIAAKYWESVLTSNATVNFNVGFAPLGPGILGGTSSNLVTYVPIDDYKALLASSASNNGVDQAALAHLPATSANGSVNVTVPDYFNSATQEGVAVSGSRQAPDGAAISNTIAVSTANYKALLNDASAGVNVVDAQIQFSSTFAFDFDPTDGIAAGKYDFIGVAVHEMGHALGFLSGAQDFDYSVGDGFPVDDYWWGYAADLFRYSADGKLDWTFGTDSYFSLDGGANPFMNGYFSTGDINGDGWQASHWKTPASGGCTDIIGIMNPYICSAFTDSTTALDISLLDAIGWNTNVDAMNDPRYKFSTAQMYAAFRSGVPEPATWAEMTIGFGFAGAAIRRRRKLTKQALA